MSNLLNWASLIPMGVGIYYIWKQDFARAACLISLAAWART